MPEVYTGYAAFFDQYEKPVLFVIVFAVALAVGIFIGRKTKPPKSPENQPTNPDTAPCIEVRLRDEESVFSLKITAPPEFSSKVDKNTGRASALRKLTIGREPRYCQIVIDESTVSRQHCEIFVEHGELMLQRCGDTGANPVLLNGQEVDSECLYQGDSLELGKVCLHIESIRDVTGLRVEVKSGGTETNSKDVDTISYQD